MVSYWWPHISIGTSKEIFEMHSYICILFWNWPHTGTTHAKPTFCWNANGSSDEMAVIPEQSMWEIQYVTLFHTVILFYVLQYCPESDFVSTYVRKANWVGTCWFTSIFTAWGFCFTSLYCYLVFWGYCDCSGENAFVVLWIAKASTMAT